MVHGIGIYSSGKYVARKSKSSMTKEYNLWSSMLCRCYNAQEQEDCPTYKGCSVSSEFLVFQNFAEWCNLQIGFGLNKYELDKDLLVKGNKSYNSETCVFLPQEINKFMLDSRKKRGLYPVGVSWHKASKKFQARMSWDSKMKYIGIYNNSNDAHNAYKIEKEKYAKLLAIKWKDQIDDRAIRALENFTVD